MLKRGAKLDVMPRGSAPACAASLPPQPGLPRAAARLRLVVLHSGRSGGCDGKARAATETAERTVAAELDGKKIAKPGKATPAKGFAPAVRQALAGSGSGGAEYLPSLARPLSPRCGLPSPRPRRDALAGGEKLQAATLLDKSLGFLPRSVSPTI